MSHSRSTAVALAHGLLDTPFAKTTHGMVRGPSRYRLVGVIDPGHAGRDAGEVLDGTPKGLPVFASLADCVEAKGLPDVCIVGVATVGGVMPEPIRAALLEAADLGMTLVNGLHQQLEGDPELGRRILAGGSTVIEIRRPPSTDRLRFWSGEVLKVPALRVAVLGTDCAVGKRTTAMALVQACNRSGIRAAMVYTGQTGWLQGVEHGFILDATPNDFICGELERAILDCQRDLAPDLIVIEGQSGLRNPAGPCGSELLLGGACAGAILQHAPGRRFYEDLAASGCRIPPLREEIEMIRLLGVEVLAVTLHTGDLSDKELDRARNDIEAELRLPVFVPLHEKLDPIVHILRQQIDRDQESQ